MQKIKDLEVESLIIRREGGKGSINLVAMTDGVGMWMNTGKNMIGIHALPGQTCIWVGREPNPQGGGHDLALFVDKDGQGIIQFRDKEGKTNQVNVNDLHQISKAIEAPAFFPPPIT